MINKKDDSKIIQVTEDKLRLTLKEQKELKTNSSKFLTFLSFSLAFGIPLFTSTFNGIWILTAELLQAIFIVSTILFLFLTLIEAVNVVKSRLEGKGDDDWFVLRVQGLEKEKKRSIVESIADFFYFTDWIDVFKKIGILILYSLPVGLWLLVISLVGWSVAWNTEIPLNGDLPTWVTTLFWSLIWFLGTYGAFLGYPFL